MTKDHMQAFGSKGARAIEQMTQHWPARQRLQHFRQTGMHAFALAGGQNDNG